MQTLEFLSRPKEPQLCGRHEMQLENKESPEAETAACELHDIVCSSSLQLFLFMNAHPSGFRALRLCCCLRWDSCKLCCRSHFCTQRPQKLPKSKKLLGSPCGAMILFGCKHLFDSNSSTSSRADLAKPGQCTSPPRT